MLKDITKIPLVSMGLFAAMFVGAANAETWTREKIIAAFKPQPQATTRSWQASRGISIGKTASQPPPVAPAPQVLPEISIDMEIAFDYASHELSPESFHALNELAFAIASPELAQSRFAIIGHTDATGQSDHNQILSTLRASAVFNYLTVELGISPSRLYAQGMGEQQLKIAADPQSPSNRRVQILLMP